MKNYKLEESLGGFFKGLASSVGSVTRNVASSALSTAGSIARAADMNPVPSIIPKGNNRWRWYIPPLISKVRQKIQDNSRKRASKLEAAKNQSSKPPEKKTHEYDTVNPGHVVHKTSGHNIVIGPDKTWMIFDKNPVAGGHVKTLSVNHKDIDAAKYHLEKNILKEEAPTNNAGDGHVDGIGVGPRGEPGVTPKNKKRILILKKTIRRNAPNIR